MKKFILLFINIFLVFNLIGQNFPIHIDTIQKYNPGGHIIYNDSVVFYKITNYFYLERGELFRIYKFEDFSGQKLSKIISVFPKSLDLTIKNILNKTHHIIKLEENLYWDSENNCFLELKIVNQKLYFYVLF